MISITKLVRTAAVAGMATAALALPFGSSASAAPAVSAKAPAVVKAPALSNAAKQFMAKSKRSVCINAHIENIGWQGWKCGTGWWPAYAGTTGQSLRIEALSIATRKTGGVCAQGHVQNIGWQAWKCTKKNNKPVTIGTWGQALRLESVKLTTKTGICAQGHVQNIGWQKWSCSWWNKPATIGTEGQSLRLEALRVRV
jgi:uncharacterized protein YjdB